MSRESILAAIRKNGGAGHGGPPLPRLRLERAGGTTAERIALFTETLQGASATVLSAAGWAELAETVVAYLRDHNYPAEVAVAPDPRLDGLAADPRLTIHRGAARPLDMVSATVALAGIAENGTVLLASGPETPNTLNFMPDIAIVALPADSVVGAYEDAFALLPRPLPRIATLVAGPSRTADIEQTILLGAHGPRHLLVVLVGP